MSEYLSSTGAVTAHFEYDPFGNTVVNTDTNNQFAYRFSTKPLDQTTGLYYYGYRWYDPLTGRWPSRDPIEERGGINLYGFVGNDGVNRWDLLGTNVIWDAARSGYLGAQWATGINGMNTNTNFNARSVPWSWFDSDHLDRDTLRNSWSVSAIGTFSSFCQDTPLGESLAWKYVGELKELGTSQIGWINDYRGYIRGDTRFEENNVRTWKYIESGTCKCKVIADYYIWANDTANFNPGGRFGPPIGPS